MDTELNPNDPSYWIKRSKDPLLPNGIKRLAEILCGCCTTENTWGVLLAELERLDRKEFKEDDDLAAAVVDHCELSEHGTSIRGGWLTEDGVEALAFLRQHGIDWQEKGRWIDDEGTTHGALP